MTGSVPKWGDCEKMKILRWCYRCILLDHSFRMVPVSKILDHVEIMFINFINYQLSTHEETLLPILYTEKQLVTHLWLFRVSTWQHQLIEARVWRGKQIWRVITRLCHSKGRIKSIKRDSRCASAKAQYITSLHFAQTTQRAPKPLNMLCIASHIRPLKCCGSRDFRSFIPAVCPTSSFTI